MDPIAQAQQVAKEHRARIVAKNPDYDQWGVSDLSKLQDTDVTLIRRLIDRNPGADWSAYLPASFKTNYGQAAYAVFMANILTEADRRGLGDSLAKENLINTVSQHAGLTPTEGAALNMNGTSTIKLSQKVNGEKVEVPYNTTAAKIYIYEMAGTYYLENKNEMTIPYESMDAVIKANPIIAKRAPKVAENKVGYTYDAGLQEAFDGGFMSGTGLIDELGKFKVGFKPEQAAQKMPDVMIRIFTPTKADDFIDGKPIDTRTAWLAGNIFGQMQDNGGISAANDDNLYGVPMKKVAAATPGKSGL